MWLKLKQFALVLLLINSVASANEPSGVFSLDKDECIILVASTKSETEARAIAKKYPGSELYTSKSGYIAVGLEKISKQQSSARIGELLSAGKIPKGSNCADDSRITGLLNVDGQKTEKQANKKDGDAPKESAPDIVQIVNSKPEKKIQKIDVQPTAPAFAGSGWLICNHPFRPISVNLESKEVFLGEQKTELYALEGTLKEGKVSLKNLTGNKMSFGLRDGSLIFDGDAIGKCQIKKTRN